MKYLLILIIVVFICSCNNKEKAISSENSKKYYTYINGEKYEVFKINNGLTKFVKYFPDSRDTFSVHFYNESLQSKDSTTYFYRKDGTLKMTIDIENNEMLQIRTDYREYRSIDFKGYFKDNKPIVTKYYNKRGKIKIYREFISAHNSWRGNNEIRFYENGKINTDSSLFFSLYPTPDSIKLTDSINIKFCLLAPKNTITEIVTGNIDKDFYFSNKNPQIKFIDNKEFLYKPDTTGYDTLRFISEIGFPDSTVRLMFLEKVFLITE